jgi:hypothetical protein
VPPDPTPGDAAAPELARADGAFDVVERVGVVLGRVAATRDAGQGDRGVRGDFADNGIRSQRCEGVGRNGRRNGVDDAQRSLDPATGASDGQFGAGQIVAVGPDDDATLRCCHSRGDCTRKVLWHEQGGGQRGWQRECGEDAVQTHGDTGSAVKVQEWLDGSAVQERLPGP